MNDMKRLTPLVLALVLAGCVNLAPKYERPQAPVAGAFPTVEGTVNSGNAVANEAPAAITWQRFFTAARGGNHLHILFFFDHRRYGPAHKRRVVDHEHIDDLSHGFHFRR